MNINQTILKEEVSFLLMSKMHPKRMKFPRELSNCPLNAGLFVFPVSKKPTQENYVRIEEVA